MALYSNSTKGKQVVRSVSYGSYEAHSFKNKEEFLQSRFGTNYSWLHKKLVNQAYAYEKEMAQA